ncbi:MAG: NifU family protein, partial [Actinomycetota bacterium]|nr:NifU family protein [Actinomycetota bacterium]
RRRRHGAGHLAGGHDRVDVDLARLGGVAVITPGRDTCDGLDPQAQPRAELAAEISRAVDRLDDLVQVFMQHPEPAVRDDVFDMLRCVDTVHRWGLRRIAAMLEEAGLTQPAVDTPEIRLLFELYQLGEDGQRARAGSVVDALRSDVASHGRHLELLEAEEGVVTVRLSGAGHRAEPALRAVVEEALTAQLGDLVRVKVVEDLPVLPPTPVSPQPQQRPAHGSRRGRPPW